ncbi:MAG: glutamine synthetase III, partial [Muribaculaceae bacterium]|nr:glutamine synthetase III [Muribaculaceae bacterium]
MSMLRFKVVEEAFDRKAVPVEIPEERPEQYYGRYVFNRAKMYQYLPKKTYEALVNAIDNKQPWARALAASVADG